MRIIISFFVFSVCLSAHAENINLAPLAGWVNSWNVQQAPPPQPTPLQQTCSVVPVYGLGGVVAWKVVCR